MNQSVKARYTSKYFKSATKTWVYVYELTGSKEAMKAVLAQTDHICAQDKNDPEKYLLWATRYQGKNAILGVTESGRGVFENPVWAEALMNADAFKGTALEAQMAQKAADIIMQDSNPA